MKKLTTLLLIAAATIACQKETVERRNETGKGHETNKQISFVLPSTRGAVIANASDVAREGGFKVWGYRHSGSWSSAAHKASIFNSLGTNVTSADNGSTWSYQTPAYWWLYEAASFFAYAPADNATMNGHDASGTPKINFTVNDNPVEQKDLLIANQILDCITHDPVNMVFDHALSRIRFSALKDPAITEEIRITGIELQNIYSSGTTTLQTPVVWDVNAASAKDFLLTSSLGGGLKDIPLTGAEQLITADNGELFMMPQDLDRGAAVPNLVVTFATSSGTSFGIARSYTLSGFPTDEWLPGKTYNYQLVIDKSMVHNTFWLNGLLTGVDEFSNLTATHWGELNISPWGSGTYATDSHWSGLILGSSIATFAIPADRPVNNEFSVNVTVKGAVPQLRSALPGAGDAADVTAYPRTIVAISPANANYLCWIGIYGNYLQVYTYTNMSARGNINAEQSPGNPVDVPNGFLSVDLTKPEYGLNLDDEYMNIQVTAQRGGLSNVYINGVLMWTFASGSTNFTSPFMQITVGDLRPSRLLRYRGAAYNFALYNEMLDQTTVTHNWEYTKLQLGLP